MRTLDRFFEIEFSTYSDIRNKSSCISVPRFGTKNAFTTELQSVEVSKVCFSLSPLRIFLF